MATQSCAKCGEPVTGGERFCGNCGSDVTLPGSVTSVPPTTTPASPPAPPSAPAYQQGYGTASVKPKRGSPLPLVIGVVIAILVVGGYFLLFNKGSGNNTTNNQANIVPTATPNTAVITNPTNTPSNAVNNPTATAYLVGQSTPTTASDNNSSDPLHQEVTAAIATMDSLTGFHALFSGTISNTNVMMEGDFSKAGSKFSARVGSRVFSAIYINNSGYISTDNDKTWQNDTQNLASYANNVYTLLNNITLGNGDVVSDEGQTALQDRTPAHQLRISEAFGSAQVTLLIVDFQGKKAVAHLDYNGNDGSARIDYSKFNEPVNVSAPTTTK